VVGGEQKVEQSVTLQIRYWVAVGEKHLTFEDASHPNNG
jgi:hypothetical protein